MPAHVYHHTADLCSGGRRMVVCGGESSWFHSRCGVSWLMLLFVVVVIVGCFVSGCQWLSVVGTDIDWYCYLLLLLSSLVVLSFVVVILKYERLEYTWACCRAMATNGPGHQVFARANSVPARPGHLHLDAAGHHMPNACGQARPAQLTHEHGWLTA